MAKIRFSLSLSFYLHSHTLSFSFLSLLSGVTWKTGPISRHPVLHHKKVGKIDSTLFLSHTQNTRSLSLSLNFCLSNQFKCPSFKQTWHLPKTIAEVLNQNKSYFLLKSAWNNLSHRAREGPFNKFFFNNSDVYLGGRHTYHFKLTLCILR